MLCNGNFNYKGQPGAGGEGRAEHVTIVRVCPAPQHQQPPLTPTHPAPLCLASQDNPILCSLEIQIYLVSLGEQIHNTLQDRVDTATFSRVQLNGHNLAVHGNNFGIY